ncbi:MAG: hypothetical protein OYL97_16405 [Candidatus Poribacteria bacterium]|nr:hypothetical protein [Candidatus Poribacteria bacterium]
MKVLMVNAKYLVLILTIVLITFGTQSSFGQTIIASTPEPLTEATLHGSVIALTLNGGRFVDRESRIRAAVSISGIEGVTVEGPFGLDRVSDTEVTIELRFASNIDTDTPLTFTVEAGAIAEYNGNALTATLLVTAVKESLEASTEAPLTEATLNGSVITLTLSGRRFPDHWYDRWYEGWYEGSNWYEGNPQRSVSGINGVAVAKYRVVDRVSDMVVMVELEFAGNIDTDAMLTLTVGAEAIAYNKDFIFQFPVTAVEESLEASTDVPLTEANLNGGILLTLTGRRFIDDTWAIDHTMSVSGIDGVTVDNVDRVSDTVAIVVLEFVGNIDTDATLTLTVGAEAIGYDKDFTFQLPVTAVEESLTAATETPLTETMLNGGVITLTLTGRQFVDDSSEIRDALSFSGIDGVTVAESGAVRRWSNTEAIVELTFSGNIDEDAIFTLTVGADAIVGYDKAFTVEFPVTAVEESLTASTEFPLTEATLDGSIITLTLIGRRIGGVREVEVERLINDEWEIQRGVSVSGIEGVDFESWDVERVSDTEIAIPLEFDGTDFDTDATLTFTIVASMANYNQALTAQVPVTATPDSNATVSISPASVVCPDVGKELVFSLNIEGGENIAGYQATVLFDDSALEYIESANGDYLPADAFFLADRYYRWDTASEDYVAGVTLTANTLARVGNGDGTLATLTFKGVDFKASTLTLSEVYLVDADGKRWEATTQSGEVTIPPEPEKAILEDINRDGVVNIQDLVIVSARFGQRGKNSADLNGDHLVDIVDLVLVASAVNAAAAAPPLNLQALELLAAGDVQGWLSQARQLTLADLAYLRGMTVLEQILKMLTPKKSALLPNYPNPFNPETWIPYHLSNDVDVRISIYDTKGVLVRRLNLGHQMAGYYTDRTKAAYWDGKNKFGEQVASSVYFYHLSAGDYSATRKMLILK